MKSTRISNYFIDSFFDSANPSFILAYVMLLRLRHAGGLSVSLAADRLNVLEGEVRRALRYWEKAGALTYSEDENGLLELDFLFEEAKAGEAAVPDDVKTLDNSEKTAEKPGLPLAVAETRPVYTSSEIEYYLETSLLLRRLFKICEAHMGKLLSYNDMCVLFSFHDWLRMPFELIELLVEYCCSNGRRSIRYIEKVAISWADGGVNTVEAAKERIKLYNKDFKAVMEALGKSGREPVKAETEFMLKWLKTYGLPMEVVLAACEKTVLQINKPTFKYADKIIESWHSAGVASVGDIERYEADFRMSQELKSGEKAARPKIKKTRFSNFRERENVEFSEIQKLENERINKELGL